MAAVPSVSFSVNVLSQCEHCRAVGLQENRCLEANSGFSGMYQSSFGSTIFASTAFLRTLSMPFMQPALAT